MLRNCEFLFNFITSAFGGEFHYTNILLHSEKTHTHTQRWKYPKQQYSVLVALGLCSHCHTCYINFKILSSKLLTPSDTILFPFTYIYNWTMISCKMSLINVGQLLACWQTKTTYITI
jgi:hypothetical protein